MRPKKQDKDVSLQVYVTPSMKIRISQFAKLYNVSTSSLLKIWINKQLAYEAKMYSREEMEREAKRRDKEIDEAFKMAKELWGVDD